MCGQGMYLLVYVNIFSNSDVGIAGYPKLIGLAGRYLDSFPRGSCITVKAFRLFAPNHASAILHHNFTTA